MKFSTLQALRIVTILFFAAGLPVHVHSQTGSSSREKNLPRWHRGAALLLVQDGALQRVEAGEVAQFSESVFLSDNGALLFQIDKGQHDFIIDLGSTATFSSFRLNNATAVGTLEILASNHPDPLDGPGWTALAKPIPFKEGVLPAAEFSPTDARYLRLRMRIQNPGLIGNCHVPGEFTEKMKLETDYAALHHMSTDTGATRVEN